MLAIIGLIIAALAGTGSAAAGSGGASHLPAMF